MAESWKYTRVAMALHWAIAFAIVCNLLLGWWMHDAIDSSATASLATAGFQLHKSLGLTVLVLSLLRLVWRLSHKPAALPANVANGMANWEHLAAKSTHIAFYVLMLGLPLSGWLYVSTQWRNDSALSVPTLWFGLFEVPHLFGLAHLQDLARSQWAQRFLFSHEALAYTTSALILLHVAAALKHQFIVGDDLIRRMWPSAKASLLFVIVLLGLAYAIVLAGRYSNTPSANSHEIASTSTGWQLDATRSSIKFSGSHVGDPFSGHFSRWKTDLQLDAEQPQNSKISTTIWTASASDGQVLHDQTLPQAEWFDVANNPTSQFVSQRIEAGTEGAWLVYGQLTVKNQSLDVGPLSLRFDKGSAQIAGQLVIDRAAANMGMESDPKGEWVSREIAIAISVFAEQR